MEVIVFSDIMRLATAMHNAVDAHAKSIKVWVDVASGSFTVSDDGRSRFCCSLLAGAATRLNLYALSLHRRWHPS